MLRKGTILEVVDIKKIIVKLIFMNDNINRNTRTLIVSFVIAIMVLIPLRFVEVGNSLGGEASVLGESIVSPEVRIEPPYDQIDALVEEDSDNSVLGESNDWVESPVTCNSNEDVDAAIAELTARLEANSGAAESEEIFGEIESIEATRCQ